MSFLEKQVEKNTDQWFITELKAAAESNPLAKFVLDQAEFMYQHSPSDEDMYDNLMTDMAGEVERLKSSGEEASEQQINHVKKIIEKYLKPEN